MDKKNIPAFRAAINSHATETVSKDDMTAALLIDTEVHGHELNDALARDLGMLEPYGHQNPAPLLSAKSLRINEPPRMVGNNHLRLQLLHDGRVLNAIGFNQGFWVSELAANRHALIDVAFTPSINHYWGDARVELEIKDLRYHTPAE